MADKLTKVFKEIDRNPNLTEHEKLRQKAAAMRDWRSLNDEPVMTRGLADRRSYGRAFGLAFMRNLGRYIARVLFR